ncbi:50S ribosomal protein L37ae [Candidatus Woesearchaeota archaeon]|nr:50S ribosomal protein L37ae [Candidatus Woesearchaeota archaeon]
MAEVKKKFGSVKRYGPRYGRRLKDKLSDIEKKSKKPNKCPYCSKLGAKRIAVGIWKCSKCNSKFTGGAYYLEKKVSAQAKAEEEKAFVFKSKKAKEEES